MSCGTSESAGVAGKSLKRHCAFCLTEITGEAIKKCGKCHKRAYCSRKCQSKDWTPNKKGQGHKNWCGTDCGEEDIDWMVTPIPGKGLGLVALRDIPAAYPIIVEPVVDKTHPGVADLMPRNGSLDDKYDLNMYGAGEDDNADERVVVSLRMSRVNHSCAPNADSFYDQYAKANILFALEDIKKGEEICIAYVGFDDVNDTMNPEMTRCILQRKWGIICDQTCRCYDQSFFEKVMQGRELEKALNDLESAELAQKSHEALAASEKCAELEKDLTLSAISVRRTVEGQFQIFIRETNSVELVKDFVNDACGFPKQDSSTLPVEDSAGGDGASGSDTKNQSYLFCVYRIRVVPKRPSS